MIADPDTAVIVLVDPNGSVIGVKVPAGERIPGVVAVTIDENVDTAQTATITVYSKIEVCEE